MRVSGAGDHKQGRACKVRFDYYRAEIVTNTIWGVPFSIYSIMDPQTLF